MAVYITGDTHRRFVRVRNFCRKMGLTRDDVVVILGDVGVNYFGGSRDVEAKRQLARLAPTFMCIHGNHEERPYNCPDYHEATAFGGTVYVEDRFPSLLFAKDGELYNLAGKRCLAVGGAYSIDKMRRVSQGSGWFASEQPDDAMKAQVEAALDNANWQVDVVFSHTVPVKYEPVEFFLPGVNQELVDKSTERWLGMLEDRLDYQQWFAGHYHCEKRVDKLRIMFEDWALLD